MIRINHSIKTAVGISLSLAALAPAGASAMYVEDGPVAPPTQPAVQIVSTPAHSGFDWGDAGIGAAGGVGLVVLLTGGGLALARTRHTSTDVATR